MWELLFKRLAQCGSGEILCLFGLRHQRGHAEQLMSDAVPLLIGDLIAGGLEFIA